jgi:hypothetical protein
MDRKFWPESTPSQLLYSNKESVIDQSANRSKRFVHMKQTLFHAKDAATFSDDGSTISVEGECFIGTDIRAKANIL